MNKSSKDSLTTCISWTPNLLSTNTYALIADFERNSSTDYVSDSNLHPRLDSKYFEENWSGIWYNKQRIMHRFPRGFCKNKKGDSSYTSPWNANWCAVWELQMNQLYWLWKCNIVIIWTSKRTKQYFPALVVSVYEHLTLFIFKAGYETGTVHSFRKLIICGLQKLFQFDQILRG